MVELLAPAGEYNSFLGAVNAGADAVYLAGNMYGARASAVNFTQKEIIDAINYAHLFGRKVYLTVNTLTKNEELDNMFEFLKPLYLSGLDAVIVQDLGVFMYVKECFPGLDIHVSTQAFVTSVEGADFYANLGAKRVVLARELTLTEVRDISNLDIETECFVHGAMCYSYSGMCLFSSFLGGNSGNRGRCKGPCRQPYCFKDKDDYILSLKDMSTVDMIDKLIDAGISSFKIEGRLKSPAYAAGVTSVYRKYIDKYLSEPKQKLVVSDEDRILLNNLYSRSGSLHGYYDYASSPKMITFEKGAYSKVDDATEKDIIEKYVRKPLNLSLNQTLFSKPYENPVLKGSVSVGFDTVSAEVIDDFICDKALKEVNKEEYIKHLNKLGDTPFSPGKTECDIEDAFIPAGVLNSMRRRLCDNLLNKFYVSNVRLDDTKRMSILTKLKRKGLSYIRGFADNIEQARVISKFDFIDSLCASKSVYESNEFDEFCRKCSKDLYLETPQIFRKQNIPEFDEALHIFEKYECIKGFYVNQLDSFSYLKEKCPDAKFGANLNLYAYNRLSTDFLTKNFEFVCAPSELNEKEFYNIGYDDFEIMIYGRFPLMQTANCILKSRKMCRTYSGDHNSQYEYLTDRTKAKFPVRTRCSNYLCINTVYNSKPTSLHKYFGKFKERGYNAFSIRFTDESVDEVTNVLTFYDKVIKGDISQALFDYTNGHMKNGIL